MNDCKHDLDFHRSGKCYGCGEHARNIIASLQARIVELEAENARLKKQEFEKLGGYN